MERVQCTKVLQLDVQSVLKQVNQGGLVKTATAFEFGLVAGLNRANCKVANPPKTLGLGWFFKSYDRGFFSGHKCWVDHG